MMNEDQARQTVIEAGIRLLAEGLAERTWGNISCRLDEKRFLITPSGMAYTALQPDDLVTIDTASQQCSGKREPSSEWGLHAAVYSRREDIRFLIHTHQPYAAAFSCLQTDLIVTDPRLAVFTGPTVPAASYAPPGSRALQEAVSAALERCSSKALLMEAHGALCCGIDCNTVFQVAAALEKTCAGLVAGRFQEISGREHFNIRALWHYYTEKKSCANRTKKQTPSLHLCDSARTSGGFRIIEDPSGLRSGPSREEEAVAVEVHNRIYAARDDCRHVIHSQAPAILAASRTGGPLSAYLDDFAQIAGPRIDVARGELADELAADVMRKLGQNSAVLVAENGALCCGQSADEARAVEAIMAKNCLAAAVVLLFEKGRPLEPAECSRLRDRYRNIYSKKMQSPGTDWGEGGSRYEFPDH